MSLVYSPIKEKRNLFSGMSITGILICINVIFFLIVAPFWVLGVDIENFIAIKPSNILALKYLWTPLTSMFMHSKYLIIHLFVNMLSLFFVGSFIEKILGRTRYLWFYLFSGIFAGLFYVAVSYFTGTNLQTPAVGASGAIFALVGLLVLLTPNLPVMIFFIPIPIKVKYAAPGLLVLLWLISLTTGIPIGNVAHLGGLVAGLIYGMYLRIKFKNKTAYISKYFS
jgi:hypothetical protein